MKQSEGTSQNPKVSQVHTSKELCLINSQHMHIGSEKMVFMNAKRLLVPSFFLKQKKTVMKGYVLLLS